MIKKHALLLSMLAMCASLRAPSTSLYPITVKIINTTTEMFEIRLVDDESSQMQTREIIPGKAQDAPAPRAEISIQPGNYTVYIIHVATETATTITSAALLTMLKGTSLCIQITLKPSISPGSPLIGYEPCEPR